MLRKLNFKKRPNFLQYVENNKAADMDWFRLESNKDGTRWFGKCWYYHEMLKYEFDVRIFSYFLRFCFFLAFLLKCMVLKFTIYCISETTRITSLLCKTKRNEQKHLTNKLRRGIYGDMHELYYCISFPLKFQVEFDIPVTYPVTAPEIALPELDGKTAKMFRY